MAEKLVKVLCSGAGPSCPRACPHRKLHNRRKANQTGWDGDIPCIESDFCGAKMPVVQVRCYPEDRANG
jgi:hypothetical protein